MKIFILLAIVFKVSSSSLISRTTTIAIPENLIDQWDLWNQFHFEPFFADEDERDSYIAAGVNRLLKCNDGSRAVSIAKAAVYLPSDYKFSRVSQMIMGRGAFGPYPVAIRASIAQSIWAINTPNPIVTLSQFISGNRDHFDSFKGLLSAIPRFEVVKTMIKIALEIDVKDFDEDHELNRKVQRVDLIEKILDAVCVECRDLEMEVIEFLSNNTLTPKASIDTLKEVIYSRRFDYKNHQRSPKREKDQRAPPDPPLPSVFHNALIEAMESSRELLFANHVIQRLGKSGIPLRRRCFDYYLLCCGDFLKRHGIGDVERMDVLREETLDHLIRNFYEQPSLYGVDWTPLISFTIYNSSICPYNALFLYGRDCKMQEYIASIGRFSTMDTRMALEIALGIRHAAHLRGLTALRAHLLRESPNHQYLSKIVSRGMDRPSMIKAIFDSLPAERQEDDDKLTEVHGERTFVTQRDILCMLPYVDYKVLIKTHLEQAKPLTPFMIVKERLNLAAQVILDWHKLNYDTLSVYIDTPVLPYLCLFCPFGPTADLLTTHLKIDSVSLGECIKKFNAIQSVKMQAWRRHYLFTSGTGEQ